MPFRAASSRTARLFAAILIGGASSALAFDPYQQQMNNPMDAQNQMQNSQDRNPRDATTMGRPMTSTLSPLWAAAAAQASPIRPVPMTRTSGVERDELEVMAAK